MIDQFKKEAQMLPSKVDKSNDADILTEHSVNWSRLQI